MTARLILPKHAEQDRPLTSEQVTVTQIGLQAFRDAMIAASPSRRILHLPAVTLVGVHINAALQARRAVAAE